MKRCVVLLSCCLFIIASCQRPSPPPPAQKTKSPTTSIAQAAVSHEIPEGEDILDMVRDWNTQLPAPKADFQPGSVHARESNLPTTTTTQNGFEIKLPSEAPVPTPTVHGGKLYVSGGFSSQEYYCFDAKSGKLVWAVDISDDGPTSAIPYDDGMYFNTESCTIFAVDVQTGKMLWSYYLGDPLMSTPTVANGRVFTVYPAGENDAPFAPEQPAEVTNPIEKAPLDDDQQVPQLQPQTPEIADVSQPTGVTPGPTHVAVCFDAKTGQVLWQKRIDGDCMTAPVAAGGALYITTLAGTIFKFDQVDGTILTARRVRATSAPVIVADDKLYYTRRADNGEPETEISEAIAAGQIGKTDYLAATRPAPYLDAEIQRDSLATGAAADFEAGNGISGGFGGGFGGGGFGGAGEPGIPGPHGGFAAPASHIDLRSGNGEAPINSVIGVDQLAQAVDDPFAGDEDVQPNQAAVQPDAWEDAPDLLAKQQQLAADVIGLGNVSTLLAYQGSRVLNWDRFNYNCMGDGLYCTAAASGETLWELKLDGDLEKEGGHLAAPPVAAGQYLFLATLAGQILQIDPTSGEAKKEYDIASPLRFPPAVHDGRIYATTQDGRVVCIDTGDTELTGWPMSGRDPQHSRVYETIAPLE